MRGIGTTFEQQRDECSVTVARRAQQGGGTLDIGRIGGTGCYTTRLVRDKKSGM